MTTLERLRDLLARDFGLEPARLQPEATLESLEIDSLRMIEILFCVEEEFGVTAPSDTAQIASRVRTLGELAAFVDTLQAGSAAPPP
jgi:acyl carrier protein